MSSCCFEFLEIGLEVGLVEDAFMEEIAFMEDHFWRWAIFAFEFEPFIEFGFDGFEGMGACVELVGLVFEFIGDV